jgi:hypothetical protein
MMVMEATKFQPGMLVEHPKMPELGRGKVVDVAGNRVEVQFRSKRTAFDVSVAPLKAADVQQDAELDAIEKHGHARRKIGKVREAKIPRPTQHEAVSFFQKTFPQGFTDPLYMKKERDWKIAAQQRFHDLLGNGHGQKLHAEGNIEELSKRTLAVIGKTPMLASLETVRLKPALESTKAASDFFGALFTMLNANGVNEDAVAALPSVQGKPVATWPVSTILPALADPTRFVFVKPQASQAAVQRAGFAVHYETKPNWVTYNHFLAFSKEQLEQLKPLGARDLLDVYSFGWAAWNYKDSDARPAKKEKAEPAQESAGDSEDEDDGDDE